MADLPITSDEGAQPVVINDAVTTANVLKIASNGSLNLLADSSGSGTITALNGAVTLTTNGASTVLFNITGTWVASIVFEAQSGDGNWNLIVGFVMGQDNLVTGLSVNAPILVPCGGCQQVRIRSSAFTSGTISISWNIGAGVNGVKVSNLNPAALNTTTKVVDSGGGNLATVSSIGALATALVSPTKATYGASATNIATALTATDVFTLTGSGTKTIKVLSVLLSGTQTTAGAISILFVKRSTANSGGTSSTLTNVPLDSTNAAATATARSYTANPTLGTTVGTILTKKVDIEATASAADFQGWTYETVYEGQPITLRGTGEVLAVNLNGVTVTGGSLSCAFVWTEE